MRVRRFRRVALPLLLGFLGGGAAGAGGAAGRGGSNGTGGETQHSYIHDYACSKWADYGCNGLYLDEKTSGYSVARNVMVNCPTNIAQNQTGTNTITDNGGNPNGAQNTIATAGIEATYADIKTLTVPPLRSEGGRPSNATNMSRRGQTRDVSMARKEDVKCKVHEILFS